MVCLHWSIIRLFSGEITKPICFPPLIASWIMHHLETYTFPIVSSRKNTNWVFSFHYIGYQTLLFFFQIKHKLIFSLQLIFVYCFHILFGYVLYINLAQNRGVEDVNYHFQKCSMKVTFRKRNLKNTFIYSDYLLKNICQEDPNSHFS